MNDTETAADQLVVDYLRQLSEATAGLSSAARSELLTQVEEHIKDARATISADDVGAVQQILASLGTPDQIAMAAYGDATPPVGRSQSQKVYDRVAVLLLAFGGVLPPVVGWLVGAVMLWRGDRWTRRDKVLGTLVWPLGPLGVVTTVALLIPLSKRTCVVSLDGSQACASGGISLPEWLSYPLVGGYVAIGAAVCLFLAVRARRFDRLNVQPKTPPALPNR